MWIGTVLAMQVALLYLDSYVVCRYTFQCDVTYLLQGCEIDDRSVDIS